MPRSRLSRPSPEAALHRLRTLFDGVSRRSFLRSFALAGAGASLAGVAGREASAETGELVERRGGDPLEETTIARLQAAMAAGRLTSLQLTNQYLHRIRDIDRRGARVNSILELNPDARDIAS
ncbi:MAG TPA: hypothetical protein PK413_18535, partial [Thermoanaerobaculia bacterium]|nr:hypothetical protein [Thermoanaerobaculia bacterium]